MDRVASATVLSDTRIRVAGGGALAGDVRLPVLEGVPSVEDPALDALGRLVGAQPALTAAGGVGGAVIGAAARSGAGVRGRLGGGLLGAGAGIAAAMLLARGTDLASGRGASDSSGYVGSGQRRSTPRSGGAQNEHVRVLNWNVRELIGPDGTWRTDDDAIDAVDKVVARKHPDVLVLQEVGSLSSLGGFGDNLEELAARLGATDAVFVPNGRGVTGKAKGNVVLTFGGARLQDARGLRHADPVGDGMLRRAASIAGLGADRLGVDLPGWWPPTYHPRTTADVLVTTAGGNDVRVLDVHLSGTGRGSGGTPGSTAAQQRQLVPVAATLDAWTGPTVIAGDFNVAGGSAEAPYETGVLGRAGLRDAATLAGTEPGSRELRSYPSHRPTKGIDRVYVSGGVGATSVRVLADATARNGSDHLPVVADLILR